MLGQTGSGGTPPSVHVTSPGTRIVDSVQREADLECPSQPISRVLFPSPLTPLRVAIIYLGWWLPTISSSLPGTQTGRVIPRPRSTSDVDRGTRPHCLALLRVGVTWPPVSPRTPVVSYTTFSPSPRRLILSTCRRRVRHGCLLFCGPFPSGLPDLGLPSTAPYGARTFLVPYPGRDRLADLGN